VKNSITNASDAILHTNCQEDLSIILFMLLYHQVSCLDYYHHSDTDKSSQTKFDISLNLKESFTVPFSINPSQLSSSNTNSQQFEIKQLEKQQFKVYESNFKLNSHLKLKIDTCNKERGRFLSSQSKNEPIDLRLKEILEEKYRLFWNFKWHGGSLLKLCNDLLYNEQFVQNTSNTK
jgi:hypothetical protein